MNKPLVLITVLAALAAACGGPMELEDHFEHGDDTAADFPDAPVDVLADTGPEAPDEEVGDEFGEDDPLDVDGDCLDGDGCDGLPVLADAKDVEDFTDAPVSVEDAEIEVPATPEPLEQDVAATGPVAGSQMVTNAYAAFRRTPSSSGTLLSVEPHGGVADDALHPSRNPRGIVPPGQVVRLVTPTAQNGYLKVTYSGTTGWMARSRLVWVKPGVSRIAFARQPAVRNVFFKHQIRRTRWNKDGPLRSGNCAPTSLAMAARVFGAEPAGLSVEESIHRVRRQFDPGLHETRGSTRAQIESAARKLGLRVNPLKTDVSPDAALTRLKGQLAMGRAVVLVGIPGKVNAGPTLYEQAFNRAYAAARRAGVSLYRTTYDFNGGHSIVVLGRDSNGRYIVGDPISEVGFVALTSAEMKDFMTRYVGARGVGNAVWK